MTRTITIDRAGCAIGAQSDRGIMRALAQSIMKITATGPLGPMTDNSGGAKTPFVTLPAPFTDTTPSGAVLASSADVNTSITPVINALKTLSTKANALAAAAGLAPYVYGGGGVDGNGTIAAINPAVSGANAGAPAVVANSVAASINQAIMGVANLANRLVEATGDNPLKTNPTGVLYALAPITTPLAGIPANSDAPANNPAVSAADWLSALTMWKNDVAAIALALSAAGTPGTIRVIAVR